MILSDVTQRIMTVQGLEQVEHIKNLQTNAVGDYWRGANVCPDD